MTTETFANNATSPLAVSVTTTPAQGTQETWTVNSTSSFPQTPGQARFVIDNEIVIGATPPASGTTIVVTRGAEGTTPATHAAGIQLKHDATAGSLGVFLQTDTTVATPSTVVLGTRVTTDTFDRLQIQPGGIYLGTGAAAPDTGIVRVSGWNVDPGAGNIGLVGGDIVLHGANNPSIACSTDAAFGFGTSAGGWSSDTNSGDLFVGAASNTNKILFGNAASGGPSWAQISSSLFNSTVPITVAPTGANAFITINTPTGFEAGVQFQDLGSTQWRIHKVQGDARLLVRDAVNGREQIILTAGTTAAIALTELSSRLQVDDVVTVVNSGYASVKLQGGAGTGSVEWWNQAGSTHYWSLYFDGSLLHLQDAAHSRDQITFTPGTSSTTAITEIASQLQVDGPLVTSGGVRYSVATITATGAITATTTLANAASGAITATLPTVAPGLRSEVKKTDASVNAVTITPATGTIDGATSFVLTAQYQSVTLVSDGTNWWVV